MATEWWVRGDGARAGAVEENMQQKAKGCTWAFLGEVLIAKSLVPTKTGARALKCFYFNQLSPIPLLVEVRILTPLVFQSQFDQSDYKLTMLTEHKENFHLKNLWRSSILCNLSLRLFWTLFSVQMRYKPIRVSFPPLPHYSLHLHASLPYETLENEWSMRHSTDGPIQLIFN